MQILSQPTLHHISGGTGSWSTAGAGSNSGPGNNMSSVGSNRPGANNSIAGGIVGGALGGAALGAVTGGAAGAAVGAARGALTAGVGKLGEGAANQNR